MKASPDLRFRRVVPGISCQVPYQVSHAESVGRPTELLPLDVVDPLMHQVSYRYPISIPYLVLGSTLFIRYQVEKYITIYSSTKYIRNRT